MSIVYMGAFPPGYGGVTIKNQNLYIALEKELPIKKVDFNKVKRKNVKETARFLFHLFNPLDRFVVGVSGKNTRKRFTQILFYFNRRAMSKSIIMVMGGTASHDMSVDPEYKKCAMGYKKIYVETEGMKAEMETAGFNNVELYPNGRFRSQRDIKVKHREGKLRCVFFSLIQPEKGATMVLDAAQALPSVEFAFYGTVADTYQSQFQARVDSLTNVFYYGVFKGNNDEVYAELSKYDVLLLPTTWVAECVPGILVEGNIAGLAEIVTNHNYNSDIVADCCDGIVLKNNTVDELIKTIQKLQGDSILLKQMKQNSKKSAEKYYIENSIPALKTVMRGKKISSLKCVFFSFIQEEKGADLVLQTAAQLPYVEFTFYGQIDESFKHYFEEEIEKYQNVIYKGIFKGSSEDVYAELAKYDILLFPTKWDIEGVPGILVEGKIAGLAEIVSKKSYNAELVRDREEGIVLEENTESNLTLAIQRLNQDRGLLDLLKCGSRKSAERYYIDNYIDEIADNFRM